jgi:transcription antitermination factor NusG
MTSSVPITRCSKLWKDINWFALQTKPRRENFAVTNVSRLGIESFLPLLKAERLVHGAARTIIKPLFPGYFFARFCPETSFESVKATRGVLQIVSSGRVPISVQEKVVREIRDRIQTAERFLQKFNLQMYCLICDSTDPDNAKLRAADDCGSVPKRTFKQ